MLALRTLSDVAYHVEDVVFEATKGVVQTGPFKGMRLSREMSWGDSVLTPKLLGCYECELHAPLELAINMVGQKDGATVINVGAAEGYYSVGLARRMPRAKVYAIDIDDNSIPVAQAAAEANGVKVKYGEPIDELFAHPDLIMMDCEGNEVEYLDQVRFPALADAVVFVEVHVLPVTAKRPHGQRTDQILFERFKESHHITALFEGPRNPNDFEVLRCMNNHERWLAMSEGRPCWMFWFVMVPRVKT